MAFSFSARDLLAACCRCKLWGLVGARKSAPSALFVSTSSQGSRAILFFHGWGSGQCLLWQQKKKPTSGLHEAARSSPDCCRRCAAPPLGSLRGACLSWQPLLPLEEVKGQHAPAAPAPGRWGQLQPGLLSTFRLGPPSAFCVEHGPVLWAPSGASVSLP